MPVLTFDAETWLIAPGRLAPRLVCLSYQLDDEPAQLLGRQDALRQAALWLADPELYYVGQNSAYDFGVLCQELPELFPLVFRAYTEGRVWDTMIFETLYAIARDWLRFDPRLQKGSRFSLADIVQARFGESVEGKAGADAWRLRYHELDGVPLDEWPAAARDYALGDATLTRRVFLSQQADSHAALALPNLAAQCASAWSLHLMGAWGLRTDKAMVDRFEAGLREHVDGVAAQLTAAGVLRPDGSKDAKAIGALVEAAYAAQGLPLPTTPTGRPKMDADTLEQSGDATLLALADISGDQKNLNTYVPLLRKGTTVPLNPRYYLVSTGRTSARNPNVQNQPRKGLARECYVPRAGWVYVGADYSAAELCGLAQVLLDMFGSSAMANALRAGRELHLETAAGILGIDYEDAVRRHGEGDADVKAARQLAKAANFGFPGGLGAAKFVDFARATYGLTLSEGKAKDLKIAWLNRYPEMGSYFQRTGELVNQSGGSFQLVHHRSGRVRGGVGFCDGCNSRFQGLVADGARAALYEVSRECYTVEESPLYGSRPVLFVHDEIILESPEALAAGAAVRLEAIMIREMRRYTPDIPSKAEAVIMRRWYKGAAPVFDQAGGLIPWEPESKCTLR